MATIKSFTSLEQSKKLAEILPIESADMGYLWNGTSFCEYPVSNKTIFKRVENIPCWSLAALLGVLPEYNLQRTDWGNKTEYKIVVTIDEDNYASENYDNPIDACYNMVLELNKLNLL